MNAGLYLQSELIQKPTGEFVGAPPLNHEQTGFHPAEQFYRGRGWLDCDRRPQRCHGAQSHRGSGTRSHRHQGLDPCGAMTSRARLRRRSGSRPIAELLATFEKAGVWAEACCPNGEQEYLHDPDLERLGTVYRSSHPQFGDVRQIGPLCRLSASPPRARGHAPMPGEHTDADAGRAGLRLPTSPGFANKDLSSRSRARRDHQISAARQDPCHA